VIVQRAIETAGIPSIIIAALPPIVRHGGAPRAVAPLVPMGANAGEPHNIAMQTAILKDTLRALASIDTPGTIVPLPYEYIAYV
jgi:D-proline reductase (dithiol) PrdB